MRGVTLEGSLDGILYYIMPRWEQLASAQVIVIKLSFIRLTFKGSIKLKLKSIYLLNGSQSEPSVESYLFSSAMYSTRSTTTGKLLLICPINPPHSTFLLFMFTLIRPSRVLVQTYILYYVLYLTYGCVSVFSDLRVQLDFLQ